MKIGWRLFFFLLYHHCWCVPQALTTDFKKVDQNDNVETRRQHNFTDRNDNVFPQKRETFFFERFEKIPSIIQVKKQTDNFNKVILRVNKPLIPYNTAPPASQSSSLVFFDDASQHKTKTPFLSDISPTKPSVFLHIGNNPVQSSLASSFIQTLNQNIVHHSHHRMVSQSLRQGIPQNRQKTFYTYLKQGNLPYPQRRVNYIEETTIPQIQHLLAPETHKQMSSEMQQQGNPQIEQVIFPLVQQQITSQMEQQVNFQIQHVNPQMPQLIIPQMQQPITSQMKQQMNPQTQQKITSQVTQQLNAQIQQQMNPHIEQVNLQMPQLILPQMQQQGNPQMQQQINRQMQQQIISQMKQHLNAQIQQPVKPQIQQHVNPQIRQLVISQMQQQGNPQMQQQINRQILQPITSQMKQQVNAQIQLQMNPHIQHVNPQIRQLIISQMQQQGNPQMQQQINPQTQQPITSQITQHVNPQIRQLIISQMRQQGNPQMQQQINLQTQQPISSQITQQVNAQVQLQMKPQIEQVNTQMQQQGNPQTQQPISSQMKQQVNSQIQQDVNPQLQQQTISQLEKQVHSQMKQVTFQVSQDTTHVIAGKKTSLLQKPDPSNLKPGTVNNLSMSFKPLSLSDPVMDRIIKTKTTTLSVSQRKIPFNVRQIISMQKLVPHTSPIRLVIHRMKTKLFPDFILMKSLCYCQPLENCNCNTSKLSQKKINDLHKVTSLKKKFHNKINSLVSFQSQHVNKKKMSLSFSMQDSLSNVPPKQHIRYIHDTSIKKPTFPFLHLSDPQHPGLFWCWKLRFSATTHINWGWLVPFSLCQNKLLDFYQITSSHTVCLDTGSIEITYHPFDSTGPFHVACISRKDALLSETESCWKIKKTNSKTLLELLRVNITDCRLLTYPLSDGRHIMSSFQSKHSSNSQLQQCNGGQYTGALIELKSNDYNILLNKQLNYFESVICHPPKPISEFTCQAIATHCFYSLIRHH